jgi:hypothetical protein
VPQTTIPIAAGGADGFAYITDPDTGIWPPAANPGFDIVDVAAIPRKVRHITFGFIAIQVGLFRFDTSSLPDDAVITAATLRISPLVLATAEARTLDFEWYDPGTIGNDDYVENVGTTAASVAAATWQAWATSGTQDVVLSNPDANISKTGFTGIRVGMSGGAPPAADADTRIEIATLEHTTRDEAKLIVTYTAASSVLVVPPIRRVF